MIQVGYKYKVNYVEHKTTSNGKPFTVFSIGDKIKNGNGGYQNYKATVWNESLDIINGDSVKITKIVNISSYQGKDKAFQNLTLEVDLTDGEFTSFNKDTDKINVSNQSDDEMFIVPGDDEKLPFDL